MSGTDELIIDAQVVCDGTVIRDGWLLVQNGVITDLGPGEHQPPRARTTTSVSGASVLPGFIDIHVHGGGGGSFGLDLASSRRAAHFHAMSGTTSLLPTLSTSPPDDLLRQVQQLGRSGEALEEGVRLLGIHLEGPYISPTRKGAHDPRLIRPPDRAELSRLFDAAAGGIRLITAAPEIAGFDDIARAANDAGVLIAAGHTDADGPQLLTAIAAGARSLTHTFNGMRPILHRAPGPLEAIVDSGVFCELICDGVHVHPTFVRMLRALAGQHRVILVTDAVAWAGYPEGEYQSEARQVEVREGGVYLRGTGTLAGSTLTMAEAARRYARFTGAGMAEVAAVTSTNAARALREDHRIGRIGRGYQADLVVLDRQLNCVGVMGAGRWILPLGTSAETPTIGAGLRDVGAHAVAGCPCQLAVDTSEGSGTGQWTEP